MTPFDLASLTKPLVTATLAHAFLDLDADRRFVLGFHDRKAPLTVRQLLSHSAGLPPWLPFTGEPLAAQLRRGWPVGAHPLLASAGPGTSTYSDLGYRLLAELLEQELGVTWGRLGEVLTGLRVAPWTEPPRSVPPGPDGEAWGLATANPFPASDPVHPHDANARAGMKGHAGFAGTEAEVRRWVRRWIAAGWPARMAVPTATSAEGAQWGLGLQRAFTGGGRFGDLLARVPAGVGLRVVVSDTEALAIPAPPLGPQGEPTDWWFHTGFTGPALMVRPRDGSAVVLLCHRSGPQGGLLDAEALRSRRWALLQEAVG